MKRLIITEKPSMGRDVAAALGATRRGDGYVEGAIDIVTWCVGHLVELEEPEVYDPKYKSWRAVDLPIIPDDFKYRPSERTRDQFKVIESLLNRKDVTSIVNAADAGREGELIFDLVYTLARSRKPVERLWISSLTRDAILDGFRNLKPAADYRGLRDSARARQQADWLVGMNATRAQTIAARRAGHDGVYSLGRVQTPTLALIVSRDKEIREFVPTTYYEVHADFHTERGDYRGIWTGAKNETRFDKREDAEALAARVRGTTGAVDRVERKSTRERPPLLYDLTTLQRAANARYSFSAAHTLEVAQSLYEKKFITYPRTSSRHLSTDVAAELRAHVEAARIGPYAPFVDHILSTTKLKLSARHVDNKKVTDHHAVIPTKQRIDARTLSPDEKRVYDFVARRFLAAFYPDAELERTVITTVTNDERFITRGTVVVKPGWREVDPPGKSASAEKPATDAEEEQSAELPRVAKDDRADARETEAVERVTKAPPRYSEASLLGAMETAGKQVEDEELRLAMKDAGLGTPATRAAVIETLLKRDYITRDRKALVATDKGAALVAMLPSPVLKSAELTGIWEQKLARIARDDYTAQVFMDEVKAMTRTLVAEIAGARVEQASNAVARREIARPDAALDCPKCKHAGRAGFLVERESTAGKFLACSEGRDVCGYLTDQPKNLKQRKAVGQTSCHICQSAMRLRLPKERGKRAFLSCVNYPECTGRRWFDGKSNLEEPAAPPASNEVVPKCPKCQTLTVRRGPASNGSYFYSCPRWRSDGSGCDAKPIFIDK